MSSSQRLEDEGDSKVAQPIGLENIAALRPPINYDQVEIDQLARLIENLRDSDLIDLLNGILEEGCDAVSAILEKMNNEKTRQGVENLVRFLSIAGNLDPRILKALSDGLGGASEALDRGEPPSLRQLLKKARTPEVRRSLDIVLSLAFRIGKSR
ncbi:MAG: DUF1641 domain-containing protein [Actinomycetota bacterium]|nr:DUF1641 domain-containing protein [Actinomycetota bacterium]